MPLSPRTYHSDYSRLSASGMKCLLKNPAEFKARYIDRTVEDDPTPSMALGSAVDCLLTDQSNFDNRFYLAIDGRTVAGKLQRKEHTNDGMLPLSESVLAKARAMVKVVRADPTACELLEKAQKQHIVEWEEDSILMKAMLDLCISRPDMETDLVIDIKTDQDPTPEAFARGGPFGPISKYRYDLQLAHYARAHYANTERHANIGIIAIGNGDFPSVWFYSLEKWAAIGWHHRQKAIELYCRCLESGDWRREEQKRIVTPEPSLHDMLEEMC